MRIRSIKGFLLYNKRKKITLVVYFYTAVYRFMMLFMSTKKLEKYMGARGVESQPTETTEHYDYVYYVSRMVNGVANRTDWESKCLVRALTARKLLMRKGITCTLYLGVGKDEEGKMIAHAWLRSGEMFVTGGNGEQYAMVAKFAS